MRPDEVNRPNDTVARLATADLGYSIAFTPQSKGGWHPRVVGKLIRISRYQTYKGNMPVEHYVLTVGVLDRVLGMRKQEYDMLGSQPVEVMEPWVPQRWDRQRRQWVPIGDKNGAPR